MKEENGEGLISYEYKVLEKRNNQLKILLTLIGYDGKRYTKTFYIDEEYYNGNSFYDCLFNNTVKAKAIHKRLGGE